LRPRAEGPISPPQGLGTVALSAARGSVSATITGSTLPIAEHVSTILVLDAATGAPLPLAYGTGTQRVADGAGNLQSVSIAFDPASAPTSLRAILMVDGAPAAGANVQWQ
jgi:hypothetical protein